MEDRRSYLELIGCKWLYPIPVGLEDMDISNDTYGPLEDSFKKWSIDIQILSNNEFCLLLQYSVPSEDDDFFPILNWEIKSAVSCENYIALQLGRDEDLVNFIIDLHLFHFSSFPFLQRKEDFQWINLEKLFDGVFESGPAISQLILQITNLINIKNNKIRSAIKRRRQSVSEGCEGGGSSSQTETPLTRTTKPVPENLRKSIQANIGRGQTQKGGAGPRRKKTIPQKENEQSQLDSSSLTDIVGGKKKGKQADNMESELEEIARFWTQNEDAFVFGKTWTFEVDISQCEDAPEASMVVRPREESGVKCLIKYFRLAGSVNKQTICVMPKNCKTKPKIENWKMDLKSGEFYIINGQHSIEASKRLVADRSYKDENRKNEVQTWTSFLVWSENHSQLNDISTFFNKSNNMDVFTPTIVNNILHARKTWEHYGRPPKCRSNSTSEIKKTWEVRYSYYCLKYLCRSI